ILFNSFGKTGTLVMWSFVILTQFAMGTNQVCGQWYAGTRYYADLDIDDDSLKADLCLLSRRWSPAVPVGILLKVSWRQENQARSFSTRSFGQSS
ncbi:uncharacterized protein EV420DRAFT_1580241, partial [Desarmillaria tabescens]